MYLACITLCQACSLFLYLLQVIHESDQLHGRIAELESELREVRGEMEREQFKLAEEKVAVISEMQKQLNSTATER